MATRTFREKKYNKNKADSFFQLNFNVYINVDNRERARVRDKKKTKEKIWLEEKREIFIAAVRKPVRNSSSHQGENERQRKKRLTGTQTTSILKKTCN